MTVDYIREREAFMDWLLVNKLGPAAQSLWQALFTICNKLGWPEGFMTVPNMTLCSYTQLSRDALLRARNQLQQAGRLEFLPGQKRKESAQYRLIWFMSQNTTKNTTYNATYNTTYGATYITTKSATYNATINKTEKDTEEEDEETTRARESGQYGEDAEERERRREAQNCFARCGVNVASAAAERLARTAALLRVDSGMMRRAIQKAAESGASSVPDYACALLEDWSQYAGTEAELDAYLYENNLIRGKHGGNMVDMDEARRRIDAMRERRRAL